MKQVMDYAELFEIDVTVFRFPSDNKQSDNNEKKQAL